MTDSESLNTPEPALKVDVAVIGGGPAGLMAAEVLSRAGVAVHLFDAMPSVGRKFLLAGKGGMNLTHAEPLDAFVGSSSRVFPTDMKAAPLLRAWLQRLRHPAEGGEPVRFHMRHRWTGWAVDSDALLFQTPEGVQRVQARATVLALGGASWARLGSDGVWWPVLQTAGMDLAPLQPSNCGFDVAGSAVHGVSAGWSRFFSERFAGQPFKSVSLHFTGSQGHRFDRRGEFVATATGVEGSLIYAASSLLRDQIAAQGSAA